MGKWVIAKSCRIVGRRVGPLVFRSGYNSQSENWRGKKKWRTKRGRGREGKSCNLRKWNCSIRHHLRDISNTWQTIFIFILLWIKMVLTVVRIMLFQTGWKLPVAGWCDVGGQCDNFWKNTGFIYFNTIEECIIIFFFVYNPFGPPMQMAWIAMPRPSLLWGANSPVLLPDTVICGYSDTFPRGLNCSRT